MLLKRLKFAISLSFLTYGTCSYAQVSEYLEVKQIYKDRGIIAVTANTTIQFANTISVINNGAVCDLPIDSRNGNYIFVKTQPCLDITKISPAQRIEVALLQTVKPDEAKKVNVKNETDAVAIVPTNNGWNSGYLDFQIPQSNVLLEAELLSSTQDRTLKYLNTSIGTFSKKSTTFELRAGYGISGQTSIQASIELPVNVKSTIELNNNPTSETKYEDMSDPFILLQHRFVEGVNYGNWTPVIQLGVGTKLKDAEVTNDEGSLRDGGFTIGVLAGVTKRTDKHIVGFRAGYNAPLERKENNVESGSSSTSNGGEQIVLEAGWQYLTPENNTFGLGISTGIVSSVDTTETSSQGTTTKYSVSNYTRTGLSVFSSIAMTDKTILDLSYRIALPYDLSEKIGTIEIEESSDKDYRITVGLSHLFEL